MSGGIERQLASGAVPNHISNVGVSIRSYLHASYRLLCLHVPRFVRKAQRSVGDGTSDNRFSSWNLNSPVLDVPARSRLAGL